MRANLGALIRFKIINDLLSGGRRGYTIEDLVRACNRALDDAGFNGGRSERTVREAIHIMKGDKLGFYAPIVCRDGYYFYDDPDYTLQTIVISDREIIREIEGILEEIVKNYNDAEASRILRQLKKTITKVRAPRKAEYKRNYSKRTEYNENTLLVNKKKFIEFFITDDIPKQKDVSWNDLFQMINSLKLGQKLN